MIHENDLGCYEKKMKLSNTKRDQIVERLIVRSGEIQDEIDRQGIRGKPRVYVLAIKLRERKKKTPTGLYYMIGHNLD